MGEAGEPPARRERPVMTCWVADDDDEASYAGAARLPGVPPLDVRWHRRVPPLEDLAAYDLLVVDPGALRAAPGLVWALPSLVHWIAHGEYALTTELPRHLARLATAATHE